MEENTTRMLENAIRSSLENLEDLAAGSKEEKTAIENLAVLYKLRIEETKNGWEFDEKYNQRLMEDEHHKIDEKLKNAQLKEQVMDRYFRIGLEVLGIASSLMFYNTWMRRGFKFEETGTYTSKTFMGLINRFKPTRK